MRESERVRERQSERVRAKESERVREWFWVEGVGSNPIVETVRIRRIVTCTRACLEFRV